MAGELFGSRTVLTESQCCDPLFRLGEVEGRGAAGRAGHVGGVREPDAPPLIHFSNATVNSLVVSPLTFGRIATRRGLWSERASIFDAKQR